MSQLNETKISCYYCWEVYDKKDLKSDWNGDLICSECRNEAKKVLFNRLVGNKI